MDNRDSRIFRRGQGQALPAQSLWTAVHWTPTYESGERVTVPRKGSVSKLQSMQFHSWDFLPLWHPGGRDLEVTAREGAAQASQVIEEARVCVCVWVYVCEKCKRMCK